MTEKVFYRTKDGKADYGFSFEKRWDGSLRAFIDSMPSYGSRNTGLHTTHRLIRGGRYYVCWNRKIFSEDDLRAVVALWSDATQKFIRTGITIDEQM